MTYDMFLYFFLSAILGALVNRVRGGLFGIKNGDLWFGLAYGLFSWVCGAPWYMSLLSGVLMSVAYRPSIGEYYGSLGGFFGYWHKGAMTGNKWVDKVISRLRFNKRLWGFAGCLSVGILVGLAMTPAVGAVGILLGATFPAWYYIGATLEQEIRKNGGGIEYSEPLYGAWIFLATCVSIIL